MIEALFQSAFVLIIGAVTGLAGTSLLIVRDTAIRARVERPALIVEPASSELADAA